MRGRSSFNQCRLVLFHLNLPNCVQKRFAIRSTKDIKQLKCRFVFW
jgi:hypothetical protein